MNRAGSPTSAGIEARWSTRARTEHCGAPQPADIAPRESTAHRTRRSTRGRPQLKIEGGFLRPRVEKLLVGTRDCTKLVDGVRKQVDIGRGIVGEDLPIHGVLCFVEADWPLIGGSFTTPGFEALWPGRLYPKLKVDGPLVSETVAEIHLRLASSLAAA